MQIGCQITLFVSILPTVSLLHWVNYNQAAIAPLWMLTRADKLNQRLRMRDKREDIWFTLLGNIVIMCTCEFSVCVFECSYFHIPEEFISLPPSQILMNKREAEKLILSHTTDESFTWCFPIFPTRHTRNQRAFELRGSRQQPCN